MYLQAGAGIVADSGTGEANISECCNKVMALAKTLVAEEILMILLIDNYDSFTYNLYQYMGIFNDDIKVVRNDKITIEEIKALAPEQHCAFSGTEKPEGSRYLYRCGERIL